MEFRRTLIMVALASVTYFLFLSWQQDYGTKPVVEEVVSTTPTQTNDMPRILAAAGNTDIPKVTVASAAKATQVQTEVTSSPVVRVVTDVLDVEIDRLGGDVVRVALPKYTQTVEDKTPFVLMNQSNGLSYIAQSGLVGVGNGSGLQGLDDQAGGRPLYDVAQSQYTLPDGQDALKVVLSTTTEAGLKVEKIFNFFRADYRIQVNYQVTNASEQPWQGVMFGQIKRDNSKDPSSDNHSFGMVTFLGGAWWTADKNYNKVSIDKFGADAMSQQVTGGWVAMVQHYFVSAWIPPAKQINQISTRKSTNGADNFIGFTSSPLLVAPGGQGSVSADFYAGPKIQDKLKELSPGLELTVDYGWLWPIAQFLFWLLKSIHTFLGNWGWSIIVLTILVKAAFFKLSATSYRSMANMRRVMPEMQRMKEQFGDDKQKMSQAMMALYKKEKINPLGGCLPILVQMPVFIALYWTLMESVELRHASWILWINDLSLMDPYFILPLLMGVSMFVQQQLNPAPQDPMQAKVMKFMPVVFTVFFLWFPAGLVLYWLMNNLLSIAQQWVITRNIEQAAAQKNAH
ncbi:MAG: membrane protein insertase YidC [Paraglaciecola sp.]|nr:membrane protein insertase YidC [Paraglaciecola sp.]